MSEVTSWYDPTIIGAEPTDPNRHQVTPGPRQKQRVKAQQKHWRNVNKIKGGTSKKRTGNLNYTTKQKALIENLAQQLNATPPTGLTRSEATDVISTYMHRLRKG